ncbi:uncharacterized protein B0H18DRAFT_1125314 [Fomitopsis serialis]|uniref:uncharacterized protein n=1 Tax=Fomitopsis serialis TaxID=139415 RepID=UPI002007AD3E|nr:uncharacterized protein B0H18DRAFT_1125314 [Neoantrodia serialis]KAH9914730.1 hypothetical protein B0H18DRAFT_1125314 [Neoantrodia serialis]
MRFFKLLAEVSVGVGTLLSGYCPEDGGAPPFRPPAGIDRACAAWGKTVDAVFNPVGLGHTLLRIKDGSFNTGWDGTLIGMWRSGQLAPSDEDWSPDLSFVNGTTNIDIGYIDPGSPPGSGALPEARKTPSGYTGTKDIILAPCIICSSLRDAPSPTDDDYATIAVGDIRVKIIREWPANSKPAEDMLRTVMLLSLVIGGHILAAMIAHDPHNVVETHVFPFIGRCVRRVVHVWNMPWTSSGRIFITTSDGNEWVLLDDLVNAEFILVVEDEPDHVDPAPLWNRGMRVPTSGPRQTRRGQKKASKKSKGSKRGA